MATLIVFGGLPGVGKTTIAQAIASELPAVYLRIDVIEQALRNSGALAADVGPAGYIAAYALAESNLALGANVVADSVNPLQITRAAWRQAAAKTSAEILEIEVICSDPHEHRRRVETRQADIEGLIPPSWAQVTSRFYDPWQTPRLVLDTAAATPETLVPELLRRLWASAAPRLG